MATKQIIDVQVLQGSDAEWMGSIKKARSLKAAMDEATRINTQHFTAVRVVVDGSVVYYALPQFPEVAYPGAWGAKARDVLATLTK